MAKKAKKKKCCHPWNSKKFWCACGEENYWLSGVETQACGYCQRIHARGRSLKENPKGCEGVGKKMTFTDAVWRARDAFMREMLRCGFVINRSGRLRFLSHNRPKSKHTGFTITMTDHFGGEGNL